MTGRCLARIIALTLLGIPGLSTAAPVTGRDCNTEVTPELRAFMQSRARSLAPARELGATTCIPIAIHIVRQSDGSGGISQAQLDQGLIDVNTFYNPDGLNFYYLADIDYIDDDDLYFNIDTGAEVTALKDENPVANAINVYFTPNLSDEEGGLCGSSSFTSSPGLGIVMNNGCTGTSDNFSSYPHEIGHYFDLFHTHSGGDELVDGSNCATAGDGLCDTPADPGLTDLVTDPPACLYTGSATDSNGDAYTPDTRQLMSYSVKNCRDQLSPESRAKVLTTLVTLRTELGNCPPVADAGLDQTVECASQEGTEVQLDGTGSSDPDGVIESYVWRGLGVTFDDSTSATPIATIQEGITAVTLTVRSDGAEDTDVVQIFVEDTTDPTVTCPDPITVECNGDCEGGGVPVADPVILEFLGSASGEDICDATVIITNDAPACFPVGITTVTFIACDDDENCSEPCSVDVTVEDTTPPEITVSLDREVLWPPNHKLSPIEAAVTVEDVCDPDPTFVLASITSDEPDDGLGDGDTEGDIQEAVTDSADLGFLLRSERAGSGDGRKYTIIYTASDASGNTASDTVCVRVPHDMRGGALASAGFNAIGTDFEPLAVTCRLIIPTTGDFRAWSIDPAAVYVGNEFGALRPLTQRIRDFNADGINDLEVQFDAGTILDLRTVSRKSNPVGLHYTTMDGADYLVEDIFKLGRPLPFLADEGGGVHEGGGLIEDGGADPSGTSGHGGVGGLSPQAVTLSEGGRVSIEIFSVTGRKLRTVLDQDLGAGRHEMVWDGRDDSGVRVPSGIYFYRIVGPGLKDVRKIFVAR